MIAPASPTGFVLAGGRGTRMGQDKVLLPWGESTLLDQALRKLRAVCREVRICSNRLELGTYALVVPDIVAPEESATNATEAARSTIGPLGGLVAALETTASEWNLFLPVDLPLLPVEFLAALLERARSGSSLAVIPYLEGRPQPLCALYHRDLLSGLWQAVAEGKNKVILAVESAARTTQAARPTSTSHGIDRYQVNASESANWFLNLNTPEELKQAQRLHAQQ